MSAINQILDACLPFVRFVSLVFGLGAAWLALIDLLPFLAEVWQPKGNAQSMAISMAIIAGALALVAGRS